MTTDDNETFTTVSAMSIEQLIDTIATGASNATLLGINSANGDMGSSSITVNNARSTLVNMLENRIYASENDVPLDTVLAFESKARIDTPEVPIIAHLLGILPDNVRNIIVFNNAYCVRDINEEILSEAFDRLCGEYGLHTLCCPIRSDNEPPNIIRDQERYCLLVDGRDYYYHHGILHVPSSILDEHSRNCISKRFVRETMKRLVESFDSATCEVLDSIFQFEAGPLALLDVFSNGHVWDNSIELRETFAVAADAIVNTPTTEAGVWDRNNIRELHRLRIYDRFRDSSSRKTSRNNVDEKPTINIRTTDAHGKHSVRKVKLEIEGDAGITFVEDNVLRLAWELGDVLDIWVAAMEEVGVKGMSFYTESRATEAHEKVPTFLNSVEGLSAFANFIGIKPMVNNYYAGIELDDILGARATKCKIGFGETIVNYLKQTEIVLRQLLISSTHT